MKSRFILTCFLFITLSSVGQYSRDSAINVILKTILANDLDGIDVYSCKELVSSSDKLVLTGYDTLELPYSTNWVFFIDNLPMARSASPSLMREKFLTYPFVVDDCSVKSQDLVLKLTPGLPGVFIGPNNKISPVTIVIASMIIGTHIQRRHD